MSRIPTTNSTAFKAIANASKLTVQHVRTLHKQGMPLDLTEALAWLSSRENAAPESTAEKLRLKKLELISIECERKALDLQIQKNAVMSRSEAKAEMLSISCALGAYISRIIADLPGIVEGLPRSKSAPAIKAKMREVQTLLANRESEFWSSRPEAESSKSE
jgi:hypothetical protein